MLFVPPGSRHLLSPSSSTLISTTLLSNDLNGMSGATRPSQMGPYWASFCAHLRINFRETRSLVVLDYAVDAVACFFSIDALTREEM